MNCVTCFGVYSKICERGLIVDHLAIQLTCLYCLKTFKLNYKFRFKIILQNYTGNYLFAFLYQSPVGHVGYKCTNTSNEYSYQDITYHRNIAAVGIVYCPYLQVLSN